jgi:hypothetical protein
MSTSCLVIATYNGNYKNSPRKANDHFFNNVKCLLENTNLDLFTRVVICVAEETNPDYIHTEYNAYLKSFEETDKIKIVWKPNDCYLSYSSYYEGYIRHPSYDYYYFVEDDYILSDTYIHTAVSEIEKNKWGYIFGVINNWGSVYHACHCLCVAKGSALESIFTYFYEKMDDIKNTFQVEHQVCFFHLFKQSQIQGEDFKNTPYYLLFWNTHQKTHQYFWDPRGRTNIVFPVQYFYYNKLPFPNEKQFDAYLL